MNLATSFLWNTVYLHSIMLTLVSFVRQITIVLYSVILMMRYSLLVMADVCQQLKLLAVIMSKYRQLMS